MKTSLDKQAVQKINKGRAAFKTSFFIIKTENSVESFHRVAFAFSRKIGKAVTRNRFKRRIRELIRTSKQTSNGCDLFVIARKSLESLDGLRWQQEKQSIQTWFETHQSISHSTH